MVDENPAAQSAIGAEPARVGSCSSCGRLLTHLGPNGECLRCLFNWGATWEEGQSQRNAGVAPGPLRYGQFEVETDTHGFPIALGTGAMAVTYRARDIVLNSVVALKVISLKLAENPIARARFLREARAAAQIHHPNVARVTHYGEQDGEYFYAMELVEGETLQARVERTGRLPLSLALEVIEQAARGLAAAEACGVVHRDLKPSNLMIESDPSDQLLVKIIDYGVAKVLVSETDTMDQTQAGFIGTPAFASPEQFGNVHKIDTRSDIYSLGATLWYLLTGRVPFLSGSMEEIRAKQDKAPPVEELRGLHVPGQVVSLLKSMLAPDPKDRPQSARELLAVLHRCSVRFNPEARIRRRRTFVTESLLVLAIVAVVLGSWWYQHSQSSAGRDRSIAVLPFESMSSDKENVFFTYGVQDEILTDLSKIADLKVISRTSVMQYKSGVARNLRKIGEELGVAHVLEGSVQRSANKIRVNAQLIDARNDAHLWAQTYDRDIKDVFSVESEVASTIAQQLNAKLTGPERKAVAEKPTQIAAAYEAYLRGLGIEHGQFSGPVDQGAAAAYAEAVQLDPNFAVAWARLSLIQSFLYFNGIDKNTNSAAAVKDAADKAIALRPDLGEAWLAQGAYRYRILRDFPGALRAYDEAQKRLPNSALVNEYLAYVERRLGHWKQAEAHYLKAAELDPRDVQLWESIAGELFKYERRYSEAQAALDRALQISPNDDNLIAAKADIFQ